MDAKPLLFGIIGFILGGLLVSIAATTFNRPDTSHMAASLRSKTGDEFDKAFIRDMIVHHEGAVQMAEMADKQAKHQELRDLSKAIVAQQSQEIDVLQSWQADWGYKQVPRSHTDDSSAKSAPH